MYMFDLLMMVASEVREVVVKTSSNDMSDELKQLELFTSATSSGSAKVMSTHCLNQAMSVYFRGERFSVRAYIVKSSAMNCSLDDLNGCVIAYVDCEVCW